MIRRTPFIIAAAAMLLGRSVLAAPPTVTPSPGYDARLQESRKPVATTTEQQPIQPTTPPLPRHHPRRTQARH